MTYGRGDHMLDHLSHSLYTLPLFATVGLHETPIRPLAVDDLVEVLTASIARDSLANKTVAVTGPEQLTLSEAVRRVAGVLGRDVLIVPTPLWCHRMLSQFFEWTMTVPLVAKAQVRMLAEGFIAAAMPCDELPAELAPSLGFTDVQIRAGLPEAGRFTLRDFRCCALSRPRLSSF